MVNPFNCYICDTETYNKNNKNIHFIKAEHSRTPIAQILKRLQNGDGTICARDGSNVSCVMCDDCIDKINAYDSACLLVKQVESELKAIILRTEKRYEIRRESGKITDCERVLTLQPGKSDNIRIDLNSCHDAVNDSDILDTCELEVDMESEEEDYDSDDSFVWPKHRPSKRKREKNTEREKKKRRLYKCIECPADYRDINDMQFHLASHRNPEFRCGLCHMRLTKGRESDEHEDLHLDRAPLQCIFCDENFVNKDVLVQHVETHNGGNDAICYICGLKVAAKNLERRHIKVHLGIFDYHCNYCDRKFLDLKQLNRHMKTHGTGRPYPCPEPGCEKRFKVASNLKAHSYTHSQDSRQSGKMHVCTICEKSYKRPKQLNDHYYRDHDTLQIASAAAVTTNFDFNFH